MNRKNILVAVLIALGCCHHALAQYCPPNVDFELGTTSNWLFYIGNCCPINTPTVTAAVPGRHDLTTGSTTDRYGLFPDVSPTGGRYSLKLGNNMSGAQAERARYYVHVPSGITNYSLIFHYAVVLENPAHGPDEQPRMVIKAFDSTTGLVIPCDTFTYTASSTLPGFVRSSTGSVYYKPWTMGTMDFTGYGGRTVAVDFATGDCFASGHFGYGYVDMNCGLFATSTLNCSTTAVALSAPPGYASYVWCDSLTFGTIYDTTQNVSLTPPSIRTTYAVILTPYPGYGCTDTLYSTVIPGIHCTGTPAPSTAYAISATICGEPDTLALTGYATMCGLAFQWQNSPDGRTWTNISGATFASYPYPIPYSNVYYRAAVTCISSGMTSYSGTAFVPATTGPGLYTVLNPPDTTCNGADFYISTCGSSTAYQVTTYYGDGSSDNHLLSTTGTRFANYQHLYAAPGTYTIRQILYDGTLAVDSTTYTYNHLYCHTLPIRFYNDYNGDCIYNTGDTTWFSPIQVRIDSAGIPVDTISATSGLYYNALGPVGTVYSFRPISLPAWITPCGSSGVMHDTISAYVSFYPVKDFGFRCDSSAPDLAELAIVLGTSRNIQHGRIYVTNNVPCNTTTAIVNVRFSTKYTYLRASPEPTTITDSTITWNMPRLGTGLSTIRYRLKDNPAAGLLTIGDTVNSHFSIGPVIGDIDTSNNSEYQNDTVRASHDPNIIQVSPSGCIPKGTAATNLKYTIHFENLGNDTAHNVYVLDTLSPYLDPKSVELIGASAEMHFYSYSADGFHILKFDFPNIKLLDSSRDGENDGMLMYRINTLPSLALGTTIQNRAGIYFDINEVVMTNTVMNVKGCPEVVGNNQADLNTVVELYPNPVSNELTIVSGQGAYSSFTITNQLGQTLIAQNVVGSQTKVDVNMLPEGLYYLSLRGESGVKTLKFLKMK